MRRSNGEGSVYQRKDGVWCGALQLDGTRRTVYGKTQREVVEKLRGLQRQVQTHGQVGNAGRLTLDALLHEWLTQAAPRLRPTTLDAYQVIADKYLGPGLGTMRVARLDALRITRFYAALAPEVSKRRLESIHGLLHPSTGCSTRY